MRNYLTTLPPEVEEAASLDGASRFQIFTKIILPLSLPGLASVAALQFTWVWNDFFMALVTIFDPSKLVATQRIPLLKGQFTVDWGVLSAASLITTAVPLLIFVLLQKYSLKVSQIHLPSHLKSTDSYHIILPKSTFLPKTRVKRRSHCLSRQYPASKRRPRLFTPVSGSWLTGAGGVSRGNGRCGRYPG